MLSPNNLIAYQILKAIGRRKSISINDLLRSIKSNPMVIIRELRKLIKNEIIIKKGKGVNASLILGEQICQIEV